MQLVQSNVCVASFDLTQEAIKVQINERQGDSKQANVKLQINLTEDCLITHLILKWSDTSIKGFAFTSLECLDCFDQTYNRLINSKEVVNAEQCGGQYKIVGLGFGRKLRLCFSVCEPPQQLENKLKAKLSIQVYGYQLYQSPAANQMVALLNISHIFKKNNREINQAEADILLGLSLLSSRRFVQAAEIFKKVANFYAEKAQILVKQKDYYILRASSLEILIADSINQPSMLNEKLQALKQAVQYVNVQYDKTQLLFTLQNTDSYECILRLSDDLIKIISRVLLLEDNYNFDALRMANMRCLEFMIEQLGCGLGGQIIQIFKLFLKILNQQQGQLIVEMIYKIVNMILQELSQATLKLIQEIWNQIVIQGLFDVNIEGQKLIMKICEYLLQADQAHFRIDILFLKQLNQVEESKIWNLVLQNIIPKQNEKKISKIITWVNQQLIEQLNFTNYNNLQQSQQYQIIKLLQLISIIIRQQKEESQIPFFEEFLNKQLTNTIKIKQLYTTANQNLITLKPILIKLLDQTVKGKIQFDCFELVWNILIEILIEGNEYDQMYELINPFLQNIFLICQTTSPGQDILVLLDKILKTIQFQCPQLISKFESQIYSYVEIFCQRVPHSIHDETFKIFDILIAFSQEFLDQALIEKCVMALIDQYTVKGQAQKQSKQNFIKMIVQYQTHFNSLIQVCLIENQEPQIQSNLISENKTEFRQDRMKDKKEFKSDNKQLTQEYEIFNEKVQFICELFSEMGQQFKVIAQLILNNPEFTSSLINLIQSLNSKIRQKGHLTLQLLVDCYINIETSTRIKIFEDRIIFVKFIKDILTYSLQDKTDSKCILNSLLILNNIFNLKFQKSEYSKVLDEVSNLWNDVSDLIDTPFNSIYVLFFDLLNQWGQLLNKIPNSTKLNDFIEKIFVWTQEKLDCQEPWHQYNILKFCGYIFGLDSGKNFRVFPSINSSFFEQASKLQNSQNKQLQLMSIVMIQLCTPEQIAIRIIQQMAEQYNQLRHRQNKQRDQINRQSENIIQQLFQRQNSVKDLMMQSDTFGSTSMDEFELNQEDFLWIRKVDQEVLSQCLQTLFMYQVQQESKIKQSDILDKEISMKQSNNLNQNTHKNILDDDPIDLDDLGIIEVDDEEWNEYDDLRKIPILKERIKTISPHIGSRTPNVGIGKQNQERRSSGNRQVFDQRKGEVEDQVLKTLRPHNQVFRPLTPPIGQQPQQNFSQTTEIQRDMQLFSDYMLQNPQQFQKIMEEIKINNNTNTQSQLQQPIAQNEQLDEQFENLRRRVDELEFDPQFSNSSQDDITDEPQIKSNQQHQQKKKKSKKQPSMKKLKSPIQHSLYHSQKQSNSQLISKSDEKIKKKGKPKQS
ncbi:unnamed protein product [Paramecium pentaurelia]|uniref:Uncharacterized protein n=1 Tax=Paramecium pentaurelia TaxID=43138 RepID=A0A8S1V645_9CILI|nr:unnamed protein product [Paramecium pentaurelia]